MKPEIITSARHSNFSIRIMTACLEETGVDPQPLLRAIGLDPTQLLDPEAQVTTPQEVRFQTAFVAATKHIPGLWMRMGLRYRVMSYGPLGMLALASPTVITALRAMQRFQALSFSSLRHTVDVAADELVALRTDDRAAPAELLEFLHERALGAIVTLVNDLRQRPSPLERIESVLDRPPNWMGCEQMLGAPVHFGAMETKWIFRPGIGREMLPMSNPLMEETYRRLCEQRIAERPARDDLVDRFQALMVASAKGFPTATEIAEKLAISERTLHRRLSEQGMAFGEVLDRVREKRAREFLERSRLSVAQIAEMLDFAETASFSRAFKRWTGMSPLLFRRTITSIHHS